MFAAANPPAVCRLRRAVTPDTTPHLPALGGTLGHSDTGDTRDIHTGSGDTLHGGCQDAGHGEEYGFDAQMNVMFSDF